MEQSNNKRTIEYDNDGKPIKKRVMTMKVKYPLVKTLPRSAYHFFIMEKSKQAKDDPTMSQYNLNDIEMYILRRDVIPVYIEKEKQLYFESTQQVKMFIRGVLDGPPAYPNHVMMQRLMTAYFGHYSTTLLDLNELQRMFGKLFRYWLGTLYSKSTQLPHNGYEDEAIEDEQNRMNDLYDKAHDGIKELIVQKRIAFDGVHRKKRDIEELLSKYTFAMASKYYNVNREFTGEHAVQYMKLRIKLIDEWYNCIESVVVLKKLNPESLFVTYDPATVALKYFPADDILEKEELDINLQRYIKWNKNGKANALRKADAADVERVTNVWDSALVYARALHDGMIPFAIKMEQNENKFIVPDDQVEQDDVEMYKKVDRARLEKQVHKISKRFENVDTYDSDADEEQIETFLRRQDRKAVRNEKRGKAFVEKVIEE